jgi:uncharacterized protein
MSPEIFLLAIVVFVSHTVETVTGFGSIILAVTLGSLFFPIDSLVPILVPVNMVLSIYLVIRYHEWINKKILLTRILPFVGLGLPAGFAVFYVGTSIWLKIAFGIFVIILSSFQLFLTIKNEEGNGKPLNLWQSIVILLLGGFVHGIYASGGPMVVYYSTRALHNKKEFRSTLSTLWLVMNMLLIISYLFSDKITLEGIQTSAILVVPLTLGIVFGEVVYGKIDERLFRIIVLILLLFSGIILLF